MCVWGAASYASSYFFWTIRTADTISSSPFGRKHLGPNHALLSCAATVKSVHLFDCVLLFSCSFVPFGGKSAHSYVEAFFGPAGTGGWEAAFERFLRSPPSGSKDRAAMRDVAAFLVTGIDSMCPRGLQALANAAEVSQTGS